MENNIDMKKLVNTLKQQKIMLADDLLRIKGSGTMLEKKLETNKMLADETVGRILQIDETLILMGEKKQTTNTQTGDQK